MHDLENNFQVPFNTTSIKFKEAHTNKLKESSYEDNKVSSANNGLSGVFNETSTSISRRKHRSHARKEKSMNFNIESKCELHTQHALKKERSELVPKNFNRFEALAGLDTTKTEFTQNQQENSIKRDDLICAVCLDYYYQPYQCPCLHIFCEPCLKQLYHWRNGTLLCPICRSAVKYIKVPESVRQEINSLQLPSIKQRTFNERNAKHRKWPLPPIGLQTFPCKQTRLVTKVKKNFLALICSMCIVYIIIYVYELQ